MPLFTSRAFFRASARETRPSASQRINEGGEVGTEEFNSGYLVARSRKGTTPLSYVRVAQARDFWEGSVEKTRPTRTLR